MANILSHEVEIAVQALLKRKLSNRQIAEKMGIDRRSVSKIRKKGPWRRTDGTDNIPRTRKSKKTDNQLQLEKFSKLIQGKIQQKVSAKAIWKLLSENFQYQGSYDTVKRFCSQLKKSRSKNFRQVLTSLPGVEVQFDYGEIMSIKLADGTVIRLYVFFLVASYSRYVFVEVVLSQTTESFLLSHQHAFNFFGGIFETVKIDNLKAAVLKASKTHPVFNKAYLEFAQFYAFLIDACQARMPWQKGIVERMVQTLKKRLSKNYRTLEEAKKEVAEWAYEYNRREHSTTKRIPYEMFMEDEAPLLAPLPKGQYPYFNSETRAVDSQGLVTIKGARYSVPAELIGQTVTIRYNQELVKAIYKGKIVAEHTRSIVKGGLIQDKEHLPEWLKKKEKEKAALLKAIVPKDDPLALLKQELLASKQPNTTWQYDHLVKLESQFPKEILSLACSKELKKRPINLHRLEQFCREKLNATQARLSNNRSLDYFQGLLDRLKGL